MNTRADWFDSLENFRHALAHRIPLYVPPRKLTAEEIEQWHALEAQRQVALRKQEFGEYEKLNDQIENLGEFIPVMTHSFEEQTPLMWFHAQLIADWKTVIEIWQHFHRELKPCTGQ